ncbi:glycosyltransferase [Agromyces kandeliae]|uniref:Glycosyltransferase n=1 Tax=Agromyces kandeliae TaxID=2666141 RepID=A0A6L5R5L7_9MICO|nr:glycosyltransferase [Agromyces kandeliae]MRX45302.1 glycosyltransferase [Agromyces kandeliae]
MNAPPRNRLVIVNRADPVICGHSVEGRNLAEAALQRGFDEVRIVTWPIDRLEAAGLPLKPLDRMLPYSPGIIVERPEPVGDYKVPDGRYLAGITGRLVELFTDGVPTVCLSLYLSPHTVAVTDAVRAAWSTGLPVNVTTIAEAVGSDVTNVVRSCVEEGRFGAAAHILSSYLAQDHCVAVSEYTRELIVAAASEIDAFHGTRFAEQCRDRIRISYPAIDTSQYLDLDPAIVRGVLAARGLEPDGYVLFLSRLTEAKGVDDLIAGFERTAANDRLKLVIVGRGPAAEKFRARAAASPVADRIVFLDDVDDAEKPYLMAGCATYVLPSKPRPEFVETFGIALAEQMLAGGGTVITTDTGGIGEAVGEHAIIVPVDDPDAIADAIDRALALTPEERALRAERARAYALQFDRGAVFERLFDGAGVLPERAIA